MPSRPRIRAPAGKFFHTREGPEPGPFQLRFTGTKGKGRNARHIVEIHVGDPGSQAVHKVNVELREGGSERRATLTMTPEAGTFPEGFEHHIRSFPYLLGARWELDTEPTISPTRDSASIFCKIPKRRRRRTP